MLEVPSIFQEAFWVQCIILSLLYGPDAALTWCNVVQLDTQPHHNCSKFCSASAEKQWVRVSSRPLPSPRLTADINDPRKGWINWTLAAGFSGECQHQPELPQPHLFVGSGTSCSNILRARRSETTVTHRYYWNSSWSQQASLGLNLK